MELVPAIPFVCSEDPIKMEQEYCEHLVKYYTELYLDEPKVRKPRTTYSNLQRFEVLEFLATGKSVRTTAKAFGIPKSTVADIKKTGYPGSKSVDKLALRAKTSLAQHLPAQLEDKITQFYKDIQRAQQNYPFCFIGNITLLSSIWCQTRWLTE